MVVTAQAGTKQGEGKEGGLARHGITYPRQILWNLAAPALYEEAVRRGEGIVAHGGPLVVRTGQYTGRSAKDRVIVREPTTEKLVWWSESNRPADPDFYDNLKHRMLAYLQGRDMFVQDCYAGADPRYRYPLRIITEHAWHSLFARNMFISAAEEDLAAHEPKLTVIQAPGFQAVPEIDGTRSNVCIALNLAAGEVLICGTAYAGEIKKSVFSAMNFLLPDRGVFPMHSSANVGSDGRSAVFFGLSGTGKTTLSATADRALVGDDEHGWSDEGVFNFEGGCYAKMIKLSPEAEPEIYGVTRRFGTVLENVTIDPVTRALDLDDESKTENTRGGYPINFMSNIVPSGVASTPSHVIMLTADAFGVLPPMARLTTDQALYYFLSGYTAKVAGTERGITEPQATFSTCFGGPFMVQQPTVYADLLRDRLSRHKSEVWLVNTGWTGGPYGVGTRLKISHTRAMLRAILSGTLAKTTFAKDPVFGLEMPTTCPETPTNVLNPRATWADPAAYDQQAQRLVKMFAENFKQYADRVPASVLRAGPQPR